jgi:plasmid stabilization system protein ParE
MRIRAEIRWLSQAERDLTDITAYYARIAPSLADSLENEVERGLTQLSEFPFSAPEVTSSVRDIA